MYVLRNVRTSYVHYAIVFIRFSCTYLNAVTYSTYLMYFRSFVRQIGRIPYTYLFFRIHICFFFFFFFFYSLSTGFVLLECILVLLHDFLNSLADSNGRAPAALRYSGIQDSYVFAVRQTASDGRDAFHQVSLSCLFCVSRTFYTMRIVCTVVVYVGI